MDGAPGRGCVEYEGPDGEGFVSCRFLAFDTVVRLRAHAGSIGRATELFDALEGAAELCRRYERLLSRTVSESDVGRLNASSGEYVEIAHDSHVALAHGLRYSAESGGRFDVTMGAVSRLWDFHAGTVPDEALLSEGLRHVGWRKVELLEAGEGEARRFFARKADPLAFVDLGGSAKGLIADAALDRLEEGGARYAYVDLGGNVAVRGGKPDGGPWRIGVRDPFGGAEPVAVVALRSGSVATSGVSERSFARGGALLHHMLDPATGMPVESDLASVSVVAPTSAEADGRSTALFSLGSERALAFVEGRRDLEAVLVLRDGSVAVSGGLR